MITHDRAVAAAPALLRLAERFEQAILYQIRKSAHAGDDEGARLSLFTLAEVRATIAYTKGERDKIDIRIDDVAAERDEIAAPPIERAWKRLRCKHQWQPVYHSYRCLHCGKMKYD